MKQREEFARLDANVKAAPLIDQMIADLEALNSTDDELNLTEAASLSGYTADHLSRLIRENKLINYGRKGAPKVRRSELPVRPRSTLARTNDRAYDPAIDARLSLSARR